MQKFKVGDIVNIRPWDDDVKKFGTYLEVFRSMEHPKIVITTDGETTTAKLYDDKTPIQAATAKCSPEDKFDFNIGAKLAMDRLMKAIEYKADKDVISVGDMVSVKRGKALYSTHADWIMEHAPQYAAYYAYGVSSLHCERGTYCVLRKAPDHMGHMLCLISVTCRPSSSSHLDSRCYLVDERSLTKVAQ